MQRRNLLSLGVVGAAWVLAAPTSRAEERASAPAPKPWTGLYATVAVTNDYRFDGVSSSNREPTYQALFHLVLPKGLYVGTEVTGVNFFDRPRTSVEVDLYGGKHFALGRTDLNLEALIVTYPNKRAPGPDYGFAQGQAEVSRSFGAWSVRGSTAWTPQYSSHTGTAWHLRGGVAYAVAPWLKADVAAGRLVVARGVDRTHWDAGATASWRRWSLGVRYYGTSLKPARCYYTDWCEGGVSATLTYRLTP